MTWLPGSIDSLQSVYDRSPLVSIAAGTPIALTTLGVTEVGISVFDGTDTTQLFGNGIVVPPSAVGAPGVRFSGDLLTGLYTPTKGIIGITTSGIRAASIGPAAPASPAGIDTLLDIQQDLTSQSGTAGWTLLQGNIISPGNGSGAQKMAEFQMIGTPVTQIMDSGAIRITDGFAFTPGYAFISDTTSGMSLVGGVLTFSVAGNAELQITSANTTHNNSVVPVPTNARDLGTTTGRWRNLHVHGQIENSVTGATGDEILFEFVGTVNKATSGAWTGINLNVTETSAPATTNYYARFQKGGVDQIVFDDFFTSPRIILGDLSAGNDGVLIDIQGIRYDGGNLEPYIFGGAVGVIDGTGISATFKGGNGGVASATGGGIGGVTEIGGSLGGNGTAGLPSGNGGNVNILGGNSGIDNGGGGNNGGNVNITPGAATGAGTVGQIVIAGNVAVGTDNTYSLGTSVTDRFSTLWAATTNVGDLNLHGQEDDALWTINESREGVFLHDRNTGQVFKFLLTEVDPRDAPTPLEIN